MLESWNNAIVTDIGLAIYVSPSAEKAIHHDRPFHGFVINDATASKNIYFSDGTVLNTGPNEVYYLPKGSHYRVEDTAPGGCWAINFALLQDIAENPFSLHFRNPEAVCKLFKDAAAAWRERSDICNTVIRKNIYSLIIHIEKEYRRSYLPSKKELLIQPAIDTINRDFTSRSLTVTSLAKSCGISEAYFRRIFLDKFSLSPKEYIINLRIEYAKRLLQSDQLPVNQVAELCGYYEPCHFSREFSRYAGISPKAYSRMNKTGG